MTTFFLCLIWLTLMIISKDLSDIAKAIDNLRKENREEGSGKDDKR